MHSTELQDALFILRGKKKNCRLLFQQKPYTDSSTAVLRLTQSISSRQALQGREERKHTKIVSLLNIFVTIKLD